MRIFRGSFPPDEREAHSPAAFLLVLLVSEFLKWQVLASVATELLYFLALGMCKIASNHRTPFPAHGRINMQSP